MELKFHTLDVFTKERFGGNPLAVVHDADELSTAQMKSIAAEFNLSETVFVMKPEGPAHSAKVRIFTPKVELPFAGHPTVGTAVLLAELRAVETGGMRDALVILEEKIGPVRVGVRMSEDGHLPSFSEFDGPQVAVAAGEPPAPEDIAQALGLIPAEIGFSNHRPTLFDAGVKVLFVPVASRQVLAKAAPNMAHWSQALGDASQLGAYVYCNQPEHVKAHYRARQFAPEHGVM